MHANIPPASAVEKKMLLTLLADTLAELYTLSTVCSKLDELLPADETTVEIDLAINDFEEAIDNIFDRTKYLGEMLELVRREPHADE